MTALGCLSPLLSHALSPALCGLQGVKLLSYLYQEALDNCSNEHYPVLLSLLKTSCEPYTRWARGLGWGPGWAGCTLSLQVLEPNSLAPPPHTHTC